MAALSSQITSSPEIMLSLQMLGLAGESRAPALPVRLLSRIYSLQTLLERGAGFTCLHRPGVGRSSFPTQFPTTKQLKDQRSSLEGTILTTVSFSTTYWSVILARTRSTATEHPIHFRLYSCLTMHSRTVESPSKVHAPAISESMAISQWIHCSEAKGSTDTNWTLDPRRSTLATIPRQTFHQQTSLGGHAWSTVMVMAT